MSVIRWLHVNIVNILLLSLVSACSFSPLYQNTSQTGSRYELVFGSPKNRLEQIVYQDLIARFKRSGNPLAHTVTVVVSSGNLTPGNNSVALKGILTITRAGSSDILFKGTRTASATYVSNAQSAANQQSANAANEQAAHQLAETLRLTILGVLGADNFGQ